jgi:ATP-dependent exoDNAse (exonuclease V) beta subunit
LGKAPSFSIRQQELLQEPDDDSVVRGSLQNYATWKTCREELIAKGSAPTIQFQTATQRSTFEIELGIEVELIEIAKESRPFGPRFGALVHGTLATIDLSADCDQVERASELQGRILGATPAEISAATEAVFSALEHPLLKRAHAAAKVGCCYRELPLTLKLADGVLVEGVADLVFSEHGIWSVVDFKTDHELSALSPYRRQVAIYAAAVREITHAQCTATLLRV